MSSQRLVGEVPGDALSNTASAITSAQRISAPDSRPRERGSNYFRSSPGCFYRFQGAMSGGDVDPAAEEAVAPSSPSGETAPPTSREVSPERRGKSEPCALTPPPSADSAAAPCAGGTPPKPAAKHSPKSKAKAKAQASSIVQKVEDVLDKDTLTEYLQKLKTEQQAAKQERKKLATEIRNAERRKSRLKKRAKLLTDDDLLQVLMIRKSARESLLPDMAPGQPSGSGLKDDERPA